MASPAENIHVFPVTTESKSVAERAPEKRLQRNKRRLLSVVLVAGTALTTAGVFISSQSETFSGYSQQYFATHPEAFPGVENYPEFDALVVDIMAQFKLVLADDQLKFEIPPEELTAARGQVWSIIYKEYSQIYRVTILDKALEEAQVRLGLPRNYLHLME